MARAMHPDSAGSQFFIMHKKSPHLDGAYAAFGKITEGMDVVNKIADTATDYSDKPLEPQVMKKVTVETSLKPLEKKDLGDFRYQNWLQMPVNSGTVMT